MTQKKTATEILTGKKGPAYRLNVLIPEAEFRYLYALLTEHEPLCQNGKDAVERLTRNMGRTLDKHASA